MDLSKEASLVFQKAVAFAAENQYEYVTPEIVLLMILMLLRHKENIKRLLSGCERKTYLRSNPEMNIK